MDGGGGSGSNGWSEEVEDLVDQGDVERAISVLESVVSRLQTQEDDRECPSGGDGDLRLAAALSDLADLQYSCGFSLKADELRSRALALRARSSILSVPPPPPARDSEPAAKDKVLEQEEEMISSPSVDQEGEEDDWETIADSGGHDEAILSLQSEEGESSSSSRKDLPVYFTPKRRGRGSFLYKTSYLYSEHAELSTKIDNQSGSEDEPVEDHRRQAEARYGTSHVLVVYDFPPSTRTTELEKIFEKYKDGRVAIRWVNDTIALAVFRMPAFAREAQNSIRCPFKVRPLTEDDPLLTQLTTKDLEPPYPRPKTSTRTAERLIAQVMGIKPSTKFGPNELRKQEEARKGRIINRQILRDEAWGSDEP